jgi:hypothetical protein
MKRCMLFGLIGPLFGFMIFCVLDHRIAEDIISSAAITLPLTYVFEIGPLLVCAFVDLHMDRQCWWERLTVAAFSGFVTVILLHLAILGPKFTTMYVGLVGAIPAVVCSGLSTIIIRPVPATRHNHAPERT